MLAQVCGLGLGFGAVAHATTGEVGTRRSQHADAPAPAPSLPDRATDTVTPLLEHAAAPVDRVLRERIRTDGLPLPGQAAAVPDAFAIAAVLLPTVPAQPHADGPVRASRSGQTATARADTDPGRDAEPEAAGAPDSPALPAPAVDEAALITGPGVRTASGPARTVVALPRQAAAPDDLDRGPTADELALAAAVPLRADGTDGGTAVLVPIAAGLLLTGAAAYKHRGLPRGH
ncbi:hypothetical protein [Kitasatospora sp. NPDC088346]|uniref:hypothetical protein n=1 Tax=Kitasatospora sp. NPDC088346 TaxID=3364073 RepID=UPI0038011E1F